MFVLWVEDAVMGCGESMFQVDEKFCVEQQSESVRRRGIRNLKLFLHLMK